MRRSSECVCDRRIEFPIMFCIASVQRIVVAARIGLILVCWGAVSSEMFVCLFPMLALCLRVSFCFCFVSVSVCVCCLALCCFRCCVSVCCLLCVSALAFVLVVEFVFWALL